MGERHGGKKGHPTDKQVPHVTVKVGAIAGVKHKNLAPESLVRPLLNKVGAIVRHALRPSPAVHAGK